jgi:EAL domain-containing protein (putative c-di-GMP-specific phosphodiesterase class I)
LFNLQKCRDTLASIINEIHDQPILLDYLKISVRIDVTVGVSKEKSEILEKAHMALKVAKKEKYPYLIYSEEYNLDEEYKNDIKWTKIIEDSIKFDNVKVFFQPIVDKNEQIIKYESLVRIVENDIVHPPFLFLDIAKKVKFYLQLTKIIILKSFKKAQETGMRLSVNLSIEDIYSDDIIEYIVQNLERYNVAHLIIFEILESENITDYKKVIKFIDKVKHLGCGIAIDDFGSGYSNFEYLLKLKPDYIKIDGSLIKNIDNDHNSYVISKTINDFAHALGMKTIAEFVHSKDVFDIVRELGVDQFQGYYFSEPKKDF